MRYTLNTQILLGGIDVTSALIGLYCIPVVIDLVASRALHLSIGHRGQGRQGRAVEVPRPEDSTWRRGDRRSLSAADGQVLGLRMPMGLLF
ncbi:MAG: hypothetical protein ABIO71_00100 [Caldimonas sp.]